MEFSERFNLLITELSLTPNAFAKALGVKSTVIYHVLNGRNKPGFELLHKIVTTFGVSAEWLITGEGEIRTDQQMRKQLGMHVYDTWRNQVPGKDDKTGLLVIPAEETKKGLFAKEGLKADKPKKSDIDLEPVENFQRRINMPPVIIEYKGADTDFPPIKMLNLQAAAGLPAFYDKPEFWDDLPEAVIPLLNLRTGWYVMIQVYGDSMMPKINHGDWIICRYIDDIKDIRDGYVHVVVTEDGVVSKQVLNRIKKRETLALRSFNNIYTTYDESIANIIQIWRAELLISSNFSNPNEDLFKRISTLELDVEEMKSLLRKK